MEPPGLRDHLRQHRDGSLQGKWYRWGRCIGRCKWGSGEGTKTSSKGGSGRNRRTHTFTSDQHRQKRRSFSNYAPTIQTSHRMCDSKRTNQAHTRKTTLCEGDKGRSGEREQITSQRQQVDTKPMGKIIVVQRPYSRGIYNFWTILEWTILQHASLVTGLGGAMTYDRTSWRNTYIILM